MGRVLFDFELGTEADNDGADVYRDPAERDRAIRYSRIREWLVLAGTIWGLLSSFLLLSSGLSARLRDRSATLVPEKIGPAMPYAAVSSVLSFLLSFPLSFYGGFVVEHRFGLSNQSFAGWLRDELKGLGVTIAVSVPLMQVVVLIIQRYPRRWWAILASLTVPFSILVANLAPVLLMPIFNKFKPVRDRSLEERIRTLAEKQGVHVSEVLEMDMSRQTKKANAMFTGLGNTKRIVLADTMLEEFTPDEIEVVLAHELGHQVHRDIWKLIALSAPTSVIGLLAAHTITPRLLERFGKRWGLSQERGISDVAALPLLEMVGGAALLMVSPLINAISRNYVEHPADQYALDLTGNREAFISAMEKLGRMNLSNPRPSALVKYLLYSHPTLQERIQFARSYTPRAD